MTEGKFTDQEISAWLFIGRYAKKMKKCNMARVRLKVEGKEITGALIVQVDRSDDGRRVARPLAIMFQPALAPLLPDFKLKSPDEPGTPSPGSPATPAPPPPAARDDCAECAKKANGACSGVPGGNVGIKEGGRNPCFVPIPPADGKKCNGGCGGPCPSDCEGDGSA